MERYLRWKWRELANQDAEKEREEETRYFMFYPPKTRRNCTFGVLHVVVWLLVLI